VKILFGDTKIFFEDMMILLEILRFFYEDFF
jgi:hypothetical protein